MSLEQPKTWSLGYGFTATEDFLAANGRHKCKTRTGFVITHESVPYYDEPRRFWAPTLKGCRKDIRWLQDHAFAMSISELSGKRDVFLQYLVDAFDSNNAREALVLKKRNKEVRQKIASEIEEKRNRMSASIVEALKAAGFTEEDISNVSVYGRKID